MPGQRDVQDECDDESTVTPRVPTLVIDKVADTEFITITGPNDALVATPSVVTWTLTYTLANGPVTNAVITDEVPVGFEFLDASDGGQLVARRGHLDVPDAHGERERDVPHDGRPGDDLPRRPDGERGGDRLRRDRARRR